MKIYELLLIAVGLSMDAFAVSVCKGLSLQKVRLKHLFLVGIWFGGFQAIMPTLGYLLGATFEQYIVSVDHWIAFILLAIIGGNMIKEAFEKDSDACDSNSASFSPAVMLTMAIATSIDACAVGVTFAFLIDNISYLIFAVAAIGITTFAFSAAGLKIGNVFGAKYKSKAELAGGIILVLIGVKILLEHLEVISF